MTLQEKIPWLAFWQIGCVCVLLGYGNARATESPLEVVRATTNEVRSILQNPTRQNATHRHERIEKMWETILPSFDAQAITRRALGVHWDELTEEQRQRFMHLFLQLIKKNYSNTIERHTETAQFLFDQERIKGDFAEVQTRILIPSRDETFSIVYQLHRKGEQWLIHDVLAENMSLVRNYQSQFNRIIHNSSYEGLIQVMEKKLNELETAASP